MIIKVITFEDGRVSYSTGGIVMEVNKLLPTSVVDVEVDDADAYKLLDNPSKYKLKLEAEKGVLEEQ